MAIPSSPKFAFVQVHGSSGKLKSSDRSTVRSHCMQGKNKRTNSRRALQQSRRLQREDGIDGNAVEGQLASRNPHSYKKARLPPPGAPPPDLALLALPIELDKSSMELLYKYFTHDIIKLVYPITRCVRFDFIELMYFEGIFTDEIFLHCLMLATAALNDLSLCRPVPERTTSYHLWRTHALLKQKLATEPEGALIPDTTLHVVMTLATVNDLFRDHFATDAHFVGLARLVELRGGLGALTHSPKLLFKIGRLDLSWALNTGDKSRLLPAPESWTSIYPEIGSSGANIGIDQYLSPELRVVFRDLQHLTRILNRKERNEEAFDGGDFQVSVNSIQARLLHLRPDPTHINTNNGAATMSEAVRLGMLAYLSTTFRIPSATMQTAYLTQHIRSACLTINPSNPETRDFAMWLLMVALISVLDVDEMWVKGFWQTVKTPDATWDDVRTSLKSIMWISVIHDEPGRRVLEQLQSHSQEGVIPKREGNITT